MKFVKVALCIITMFIFVFPQLQVHADSMVKPSTEDINVYGHCTTTTTSQWIIQNKSDQPIVVEYQLNDETPATIEISGQSQEVVELPLRSKQDILHIHYETFSKDATVSSYNCSPAKNNKNR